MESFGSVSGLGESIRINLLSKRLDPLVPFPHKHDFYQLLLITRGEGSHEIDFVRHTVQKGSVFVMRPAQVHTWDLSRDAEGYVIEFHGNVLNFKDPHWQTFKHKLPSFPNAQILAPKKFDKLIESVAYSYEEYHRREANFSIVLLAELLKFLTLLERSLAKPLVAETLSSELFDEFNLVLEDHFRSEHSVNFYAQELRLSPKALTMRFQRAGLKSPRDYIQERCLLEAKRLLVYSSSTIQDISERLGFEDPNYFARFFRKQTGQSPGQFRSQA